MRLSSAAHTHFSPGSLYWGPRDREVLLVISPFSLMGGRRWITWAVRAETQYLSTAWRRAGWVWEPAGTEAGRGP